MNATAARGANWSGGAAFVARSVLTVAAWGLVVAPTAVMRGAARTVVVARTAMMDRTVMVAGMSAAHMAHGVAPHRWAPMALASAVTKLDHHIISVLLKDC